MLFTGFTIATKLDYDRTKSEEISIMKNETSTTTTETTTSTEEKTTTMANLYPRDMLQQFGMDEFKPEGKAMLSFSFRIIGLS